MLQKTNRQSDTSQVVQLIPGKTSRYTPIDRLMIKSHMGLQIVKIEDILLIEAEGNYALIHSRDGSKLTVSKTLKHYEIALSAFRNFIRVHKTYLVNANFIESISNTHELHIQVVVKPIPVSRRLRSTLLEAVGLMCIQ